MTTRRRAQSLVEFAVVVPVFLLLLFALIDFSRLLFTYISLSNGAREMARVAAISTAWRNPTAASTAAVNAFKNATIVADGHFTNPPNSNADQVTVQWGDQDCARNRDIGVACTSQHPLSSQVICPLSTMSCTTWTQAPPAGGFVEVTATYTFNFNPLFQTRLDGIIDVSFMRPSTQLTTTSRAYVE